MIIGTVLSLAVHGCREPVTRPSKAPPDPSPSETPPNIVFLLSDDHRYDFLSCAGHPIIRTPNLDRLAARGVRFTNAFVPNSLCLPSRACFQTGQFASRHGVRNNRQLLSGDAAIWANPLKKTGYRTSHFGRWYLGEKTTPRPEFDRWVSFQGENRYVNPQLNVEGDVLIQQGYLADILVDNALEEIRRSKDQPFALSVCFKTPHQAYHPPARHESLYADAVFAPPEGASQSHQSVSPMKSEMPQARKCRLHLSNPKDYQRVLRGYARMIATLDEAVGRIMDELDRLGLTENTIVVYAGDNGICLGEHQMMGKSVMYEESIRIPLIVSWPGRIPAGQTVDDMVLNVDLAPTMLDLAGLPIPPTMQGQSCKPLLEGQRIPWRNAFYYWSQPVAQVTSPTPVIEGIRTDRYKLILYDRDPQETEFFDLQTDPHELYNLYAAPDHRATVQRLLAEMEALKAAQAKGG